MEALRRLTKEPINMPEATEATFCTQCRKYQKNIEWMEEQTTAKFLALKKKIISTDSLITKYKEQTNELSSCRNDLSTVLNKLRLKDGELEKAETSLKNNLEELNILRESRSKLDREHRVLSTEHQFTKDQLVAAQVHEKLLSSQTQSLLQEKFQLQKEHGELQTNIRGKDRRKIDSLQQKLNKSKDLVEKMKDEYREYTQSQRVHTQQLQAEIRKLERENRSYKLSGVKNSPIKHPVKTTKRASPNKRAAAGTRRSRRLRVVSHSEKATSNAAIEELRRDMITPISDTTDRSRLSAGQFSGADSCSSDSDLDADDEKRKRSNHLGNDNVRSSGSDENESVSEMLEEMKSMRTRLLLSPLRSTPKKRPNNLGSRGHLRSLSSSTSVSPASSMRTRRVSERLQVNLCDQLKADQPNQPITQADTFKQPIRQADTSKQPMKRAVTSKESKRVRKPKESMQIGSQTPFSNKKKGVGSTESLIGFISSSSSSDSDQETPPIPKFSSQETQPVHQFSSASTVKFTSAKTDTILDGDAKHANKTIRCENATEPMEESEPEDIVMSTDEVTRGVHKPIVETEHRKPRVEHKVNASTKDNNNETQHETIAQRGNPPETAEKPISERKPDPPQRKLPMVKPKIVRRPAPQAPKIDILSRKYPLREMHLMQRGSKDGKTDSQHSETELAESETTKIVSSVTELSKLPEPQAIDVSIHGRKRVSRVQSSPASLFQEHNGTMPETSSKLDHYSNSTYTVSKSHENTSLENNPSDISRENDMSDVTDLNGADSMPVSEALDAYNKPLRDENSVLTYSEVETRDKTSNSHRGREDEAQHGDQLDVKPIEETTKMTTANDNENDKKSEKATKSPKKKAAEEGMRNVVVINSKKRNQKLQKEVDKIDSGWISALSKRKQSPRSSRLSIKSSSPSAGQEATAFTKDDATQCVVEKSTDMDRSESSIETDTEELKTKETNKIPPIQIQSTMKLSDEIQKDQMSELKGETVVSERTDSGPNPSTVPHKEAVTHLEKSPVRARHASSLSQTSPVRTRSSDKDSKDISVITRTGGSLAESTPRTRLSSSCSEDTSRQTRSRSKTKESPTNSVSSEPHSTQDQPRRLTRSASKHSAPSSDEHANESDVDTKVVRPKTMKTKRQVGSTTVTTTNEAIVSDKTVQETSSKSQVVAPEVSHGELKENKQDDTHGTKSKSNCEPPHIHMTLIRPSESSKSMSTEQSEVKNSSASTSKKFPAALKKREIEDPDNEVICRKSRKSRLMVVSSSDGSDSDDEISLHTGEVDYNRIGSKVEDQPTTNQPNQPSDGLLLTSSQMTTKLIDSGPVDNKSPFKPVDGIAIETKTAKTYLHHDCDDLSAEEDCSLMIDLPDESPASPEGPASPCPQPPDDSSSLAGANTFDFKTPKIIPVVFGAEIPMEVESPTPVIPYVSSTPEQSTSTSSPSRRVTRSQLNTTDSPQLPPCKKPANKKDTDVSSEKPSRPVEESEEEKGASWSIVSVVPKRTTRSRLPITVETQETPDNSVGTPTARLTKRTRKRSATLANSEELVNDEDVCSETRPSKRRSTRSSTKDLPKELSNAHVEENIDSMKMDDKPKVTRNLKSADDVKKEVTSARRKTRASHSKTSVSSQSSDEMRGQTTENGVDVKMDSSKCQNDSLKSSEPNEIDRPSTRKRKKGKSKVIKTTETSIDKTTAISTNQNSDLGAEDKPPTKKTVKQKDATLQKTKTLAADKQPANKKEKKKYSINQLDRVGRDSKVSSDNEVSTSEDTDLESNSIQTTKPACERWKTFCSVFESLSLPNIFNLTEKLELIKPGAENYQILQPISNAKQTERRAADNKPGTDMQPLDLLDQMMKPPPLTAEQKMEKNKAKALAFMSTYLQNQRKEQIKNKKKNKKSKNKNSQQQQQQQQRQQNQQNKTYSYQDLDPKIKSRVEIPDMTEARRHLISYDGEDMFSDPSAAAKTAAEQLNSGEETVRNSRENRYCPPPDSRAAVYKQKRVELKLEKYKERLHQKYSQTFVPAKDPATT